MIFIIFLRRWKHAYYSSDFTLNASNVGYVDFNSTGKKKRIPIVRVVETQRSTTVIFHPE